MSNVPSSVQMHPGHDPLEGVSPGGIIATGARRSAIPVAFEPVIQESIARVNALPGAHCLYVYGSVATGMAQVGSSDVDLVTIGLDRGSAVRMGRELSAAFPRLCRGVDVGPAQPGDYEGSGDEAYGNRVFLRHYCVHLAGPDPARRLPDCHADAAAARGFNGDIGLCLDRWRRELAGEPSAPALGRRIARKTLLAVAGLVSMHDTTWTTDRLAAARRWAVVRPDLAAPLQALAGWSNAATPAPTPSEVRSLLDGLVADVVDEFRRHIGLWKH